MPYAVSKAALERMTKLLARALAPTVRANAVAPGLVENDWTASWTPADRSRILDRIPLQRPGEAAEIAEACLYLAAARYVTGAVLSVDGGITI